VFTSFLESFITWLLAWNHRGTLCLFFFIPCMGVVYPLHYYCWGFQRSIEGCELAYRIFRNIRLISYCMELLVCSITIINSLRLLSCTQLVYFPPRRASLSLHSLLSHPYSLEPFSYFIQELLKTTAYKKPHFHRLPNIPSPPKSPSTYS